MPHPLPSSELASSLPIGSITGLLRAAFHWMRSRQTAEMVDFFLYEACRLDPELGRRARLVGWFGLLGFLFGVLYAGFYFLVGHIWGVWIVTICSFGFLATPFLMRALQSVAIGGNFLAAMMALGFTALCYVEGGMRGHAVAWLASVPLCALLLVGKKSAGIWVIVAFAAAASVVACELAEIELPIKYDLAWHPLINSAGYLGLIAFMFALGLIFEVGREQAFGKMTEALETLAAANDRLSVLNKDKTEFMGIAAHDLRNPLTIIISYADMLREGGRADSLPQFAGAIYDAGTRMRDLIVNLLDANAIEEGHFSCTVERCDVGPLIAQSLTQNQINAVRKGTEVATFAPASLFAQADPSSTIQVLDNLISNAVKYSPPKSRVLVQAAVADDRVLISVKDEGPGISAEDQTQLFGKFTRLTARPTGGESSTGLGLSIVKRLVEAMQGTIECQSVLGHGATFTVSLPIWNESTP